MFDVWKPWSCYRFFQLLFDDWFNFFFNLFNRQTWKKFNSQHQHLLKKKYLCCRLNGMIPFLPLPHWNQTVQPVKYILPGTLNFARRDEINRLVSSTATNGVYIQPSSRWSQHVQQTQNNRRRSWLNRHKAGRNEIRFSVLSRHQVAPPHLLRERLADDEDVIEADVGILTDDVRLRVMVVVSLVPPARRCTLGNAAQHSG